MGMNLRTEQGKLTHLCFSTNRPMYKQRSRLIRSQGFRNKQGIGKNNMNLAAIEGSGETDGDDKAGVLDLIAA
ncbi:hypothetical protein [Oryza sativa Japonica Group]|uniref:Uncharacterized protein n=1 Tax=Oryza sativa subsp. japonica TaxID=39947 RepID=Q5ZBL8_ORYSJ|nr:hypothetical protein [Oryza sativa Japonica Group]BAD61481.1 hypothetical protein [Oryza sativa Japonica Group]